jgi:gliding motility-associated protein GldM
MAAQKLPPRQRMINMMYLVLTAMLALNVTAEVLNAFKTVDDGIGRSNHALTVKTASLFNEFDMQMGLDAKKAEPFKLKAEAAQRISKALYDRLEQYKQQIIKEAGGTDPATGQLVHNDDIDIATRLFVEQAEGKKLKADIEQARQQLLALPADADRGSFASSIPLQTEEPKDGLSWEFHKFNHVPAVAAVTLLSKYQNDVLASENQLVEYFYSKIDYDKHKVDKLAAVVTSPSNYIMQGLSYRANVMLSAYSSTQNPDVFIGGFTAAVKKNANGSYEEIKTNTETPPLTNAVKVDVANGLGKIQMPGNSVGQSRYTGVIRVKDPSGTGYVFYPFDGEYQVAPKTAVVSPTNMNVLYYGLENPVSVSVPGAAQRDVSAAFDGPGTIERKADGSFIVRPTAGRGRGKVRVSAKVDGSTLLMGEQEFRIKRIPNPVSTLDGSYLGGSIPLGFLKSTKGVVAKVDNFDWPVNFKVLSYTVSYRASDGTIIKIPIEGPVYDTKVRNLIDRRIKPGEMIFFDDIVAKGPDEEKRNINPIAFLIK